MCCAADSFCAGTREAPNMEPPPNFRLFIVTLFVMCALQTSACEELMELTCADATKCRLFQHTGVNVSCVEGGCRCSQANGERIKCRPNSHKLSNIIGGPCPCSLPQSECNTAQDICYCAPDYVASADRRRCLKKSVPLGGTCELQTQCIAQNNYAACNASLHLCQCDVGFVMHDGICLSMLLHSASCHNDTQCQALYSTAYCWSNVCLCPLNFVSNPKKEGESNACLPIAEHQQPCNVSAQCQWHLGSGAVCSGGMCQCDAAYSVVELKSNDGTVRNSCEPYVVLGTYCRDDSDCQQHHLSEADQTMFCFFGECNCKHGYNSNNNVNCTQGSGASSTKLHKNLFTLWSFLALAVLFKKSCTI